MAQQIYWVSKREQLEATISPIRHDIVDRLTLLGPLSVRALAKAMGRKPTAIYRHLQKLEKLGLIRAAEVTGARGRPAAIYQAAAPLMRFARAPRIAENRPVMAKIAKSLAVHAAREYAVSFKSDKWEIDGPGRNQWLFRLLIAPSPKKLARINTLLDELAELIWTPDPNPGPLMRMTWIMSPASDVRQKKRKKR